MSRIIKIYLTDEIPEDDLKICCFTIQSLKEALLKKQKYIVTTQTHAISSSLYDENDGDIIVINGKEQLSFRKVLAGEYDKYIREIRIAHNWEKMLYSGIFYIPNVFTWEV